jgi:hypothetical protein
MTVSTDTVRPVALVDLGASAGLNLVADKLGHSWVDENAQPVPVLPLPNIVVRLGLDLTPLDVRDPEDAMWLRACVWPSDRARLARLDQALAAFKATAAAPGGPVLESCSLVDAPSRLSSLPDDLFVLCVQTIVRDYLPPSDRTRYEGGMRDWLLRRSPRSALVAELEVDQAALATPARSATLVLRMASSPGIVDEWVVARTHPHPRQLFMDREAVSRCAAALR